MYLSSFCSGFVFKMAEIRDGTGNTFGTLFRVTTFGESHVLCHCSYAKCDQQKTWNNFQSPSGISAKHSQVTTEAISFLLMFNMNVSEFNKACEHAM